MIHKDEVLNLAKPYQWIGGMVEGWTFNTEAELLAFANAIAERVSDKRCEQDAEILTGDPSEFFLGSVMLPMLFAQNGY